MAIKMVIVAIVMVCIVMASPIAEADTSCGFVSDKIASCIPYLEGNGASAASASSPPTPCCDGIKALNNAASTTPDRQAVCECLKNAAASLGSKINLNLAASLPSKCGVSVPYKISPNTDCTKVH